MLLQRYAKDHYAGSLWPLGYADVTCSAVMAAGVGWCPQ